MTNKSVPTIYCTIFDDNYLARALVLYSSLMRCNKTAIFAFFCIDDRSAELLDSLQLGRSLVLRHTQFATPELTAIRHLRNRGEYCWTCKPVALLYLMNNAPSAEWVVYVDTDMMFFVDPDNALPGLDSHYLITPHRFHPAFSSYEKTAGRYNAGYVAARSSTRGREVIEWWQGRCLESCTSIPTSSTYADQKYLDHFLVNFPFGSSSAHKGLNAAPWNIENYVVSSSPNGLFVDEVSLLLYHFQGLKVFDNQTASLYIGNRRLSTQLRQSIYRPYIDELRRAYCGLREKDKNYSDGLVSRKGFGGSPITRGLKWIRGQSNDVPFLIE